MSEIKNFVLSLVSISTVSIILEGFLPKSELKKYVKYLFSLIILLIIVTPIGNVILKTASLDISDFSYKIESGKLYGASDRARSIVCEHIEKSLRNKFSISDGNIRVEYKNDKYVVNIKKSAVIFADDVRIFILNNFGFDSEVVFYE